MKKILKQNLHYIIFAIFLLIHSLVCIFTTYFGDDYYYAAFIKKGADYFVSENIFHYQYTNGRALVHLIDELLLGVELLVLAGIQHRLRRTSDCRNRENRVALLPR